MTAEKPFDINKPYWCREPKRWTASAIVGPNGLYYGWLRNAAGEVEDAWWDVSGLWFSAHGENSRDLVNVPQKHVRWVNIYGPADSANYTLKLSKKQADEKAASDRIACVRIEFEEGEGLNEGAET